MNIEQYWATLPALECADKAMDRIEEYYKSVLNRRLGYIWRQSYRRYHAAVTSGPDVSRGGEQGEYSMVSVNHYRNLAEHMLNMTISQRPSFEPRATNTDMKSQTQVVLARGLLDYYLREKRLEPHVRRAALFAVLYGEGYVHQFWDSTSGEVHAVDPDTGIEVREGDIRVESLEPVNVIRDPSLNNWHDRSWVILRSFVNKHDLAAKYPDLAEDIVALSWRPNGRNHYMAPNAMKSDSDIIPMYTLYHVRSDSVPDGRILQFLDKDIVLKDGALPYRKLPLTRLAGGELIGTPFGYSFFFDLLPIQQLIDNAYSTISSNQDAFGVQVVMSPKGGGFTSKSFEGLTLIEYDPALPKPEAMNFTQTPAEIFNFLRILEQTMETLSGVNSVTRGQPEASLKSGAALALVQSMAIQFAQGLQASYVQLLEEVGTYLISILKDYASIPRIAYIAGKSQRGAMKQFTGDDLSHVNRVQVDIGNPLTRTTAGKVELAQMMLQAGLIKTPDQMLAVIETGNLETLTEGKMAELLSIKAENERLADGQPVVAMVTDEHLLHIMEHKAVVSDPAAREDPTTVEAVTAHIMEHYKFLTDPALAKLIALMGNPQVPPDQPAGMPDPTGAMQDANSMVAEMQPNAPKVAGTNQEFALPQPVTQ